MGFYIRSIERMENAGAGALRDSIPTAHLTWRNPVMNHPTPYFMHDQARHRVARLMAGRARPRTLASPIWPLLAVVTVLTVINVVTAIPQL